MFGHEIGEAVDGVVDRLLCTGLGQRGPFALRDLGDECATKGIVFKQSV